jgi:hypothetical protein
MRRHAAHFTKQPSLIGIDYGAVSEGGVVIRACTASSRLAARRLTARDVPA